MFSGIARMLALSAGCFVALPQASAVAQARIESLPGRWVHAAQGCADASCRQVYDFAPCGAGWCGVEVIEGSCGRVAFRLARTGSQQSGVELTGRFERTRDSAPYTVRAVLRGPSRYDAQPAAESMVVVGNTGDSLQLFRRTFPLHMVLRREGDGACNADASLS